MATPAGSARQADVSSSIVWNGESARTITPSGSSISLAMGVACVTRADDVSVMVAPMMPDPIISSRSALPVSCISLVSATVPPAPVRLKTGTGPVIPAVSVIFTAVRAVTS